MVRLDDLLQFDNSAFIRPNSVCPSAILNHCLFVIATIVKMDLVMKLRCSRYVVKVAEFR
jgi:hypothetical protein